MSDSDVNAAAERWRLDNKAEEHKEYARSPYKGNFDLRLEDAYLLAEAYLALHPADDGEAIDEAWLRSMGFTKHEWHHQKWTFYRSTGMPIGLWHVEDGWKAMLIHSEAHASCLVRAMTTRGQLRRLLAAIG